MTSYIRNIIITIFLTATVSSCSDDEAHTSETRHLNDCLQGFELNIDPDVFSKSSLSTQSKIYAKIATSVFKEISINSPVDWIGYRSDIELIALIRENTLSNCFLFDTNGYLIAKYHKPYERLFSIASTENSSVFKINHTKQNKDMSFEIKIDLNKNMIYQSLQLPDQKIWSNFASFKLDDDGNIIELTTLKRNKYYLNPQGQVTESGFTICLDLQGLCGIVNTNVYERDNNNLLYLHWLNDDGSPDINEYTNQLNEKGDWVERVINKNPLTTEQRFIKYRE